MRLARVDLDGDEVVVNVNGAQATVLARGGQDELVRIAMSGVAPNGGDVVPLDRVKLLAPLGRPGTIRDFYAFEEHVRNAKAVTGQGVDPAWYERPWFYFTNPSNIIGPDGVVCAPQGSERLDYELELGVVVGQACEDLDPDDPATMDVIAGFTIFNDWSARDIQVGEMKTGLGVQKSKDFASGLGPCLVTKDEVPDLKTGRPAFEMKARVNGEQWSHGNSSTIHYSWMRILAEASKDNRLWPGDVIGSGTVGSGCILELHAVGLADTRPWLKPGDVVELEIEKVGILRNTIGTR